MRSSPKTNTYCLPIIKRTRAQVTATIKANLKRFRYFEVWLDYINDIDLTFAASLVSLYPNRLIMVLRRQHFKKQAISSAKRLAILQTLSNRPVLVDLDVVHQRGEIMRVHNEGLSLQTILSYHNFSRTPSNTELRTIVARAESLGAHITKISAFCKNQRDALRLLSLLVELRESGRKCVVLGMGEHGSITRVFGPLWGNELSFAPLKVQQRSAPGQIALDKLDSIMQALG